MATSVAKRLRIIGRVLLGMADELGHVALDSHDLRQVEEANRLRLIVGDIERDVEERLRGSAKPLDEAARSAIREQRIAQLLAEFKRGRE